MRDAIAKLDAAINDLEKLDKADAKAFQESARYLEVQQLLSFVQQSATRLNRLHRG